jgi:hypothetical protein
MKPVALVDLSDRTGDLIWIANWSSKSQPFGKPQTDASRISISGLGIEVKWEQVKEKNPNQN